MPETPNYQAQVDAAHSAASAFVVAVQSGDKVKIKTEARKLQALIDAIVWDS